MRRAWIGLGIVVCGAIAPGAEADYFFDNYSTSPALYSSTQTKYFDGAATYISNVARDTTITGISALNHIVATPSTNATLQFLIYDRTTGEFVYQSAPTTFKGDGLIGSSATFKSSAAFSVVLKAGDSYDVGYLADSTIIVPFATSGDLPTYLQGDLTAGASFHDFSGAIGNPSSTSNLVSRMIPIRLTGLAAVPVPASAWLMGSGFLGTLLRRRRA